MTDPIALNLMYYKSRLGTTSRYAADRLDDIHNVKDFGAVGDGVTDDTAAIQACVDWEDVTLTVTAQTLAGDDIVVFGGGLPDSIKTNVQISVHNLTNPASLVDHVGLTRLSSTAIQLASDALENVDIGDQLRFRHPDKGIIFFPVGDYLVDAPITFDQLACNIVFQGCGRGSRIFGDVPGDAILSRTNGNIVAGTRIIRDLHIQNDSGTGVGVNMIGCVGTNSVQDCIINAWRGIVSENAQCLLVSDVQMIGSGRSAGSIGIMAGNGCVITNCDISAYDHAIRHTNLGLCVIGGRYEVNNTAIHLGQNLQEELDPSSAVTIQGTSMESNFDHSVYCQAVNGFEFLGMCLGGALLESTPISFIDFRGAAGGVVSGCSGSFAYTFSAAAFDLSQCDGGVVFNGCIGSDADGPSWLVPTDRAIGFTFNGCNFSLPPEYNTSEFVDDFFGASLDTTKWSTTAGSGVGTSAAVPTAGHGGRIYMASSSALGTNAQIASLLTLGNLPFSGNLGAYGLETRLMINDPGSLYLFVGFTDTISTTVELPIYKASGTDDIDSDATDACGVCFDTQGTTDQWFIGGVMAGADTAATHSGTAPGSFTMVDIGVHVSNLGAVTGSINGVSIGTIADAISNGTSVTPCIVIANRSADLRYVIVDYVKVSSTRS